MLDDGALQALAQRLVAVPGVLAVMLGGSRARGDHDADSDVDLGLYYRPPLDTATLRDLARSVATARADRAEPELTEPGEWGPWVDGGGWLTIDGLPVDWIYRDINRVGQCVARAVAGQLAFHFQVGHPFGFPDVVYAGEVALGVVLADPTGELNRLKQRLDPYPEALVRAMVQWLAEARFLLGVLTKPARRADTTYVAGCLFRVVTLCAYAIHARAGRWVINEKGIIDAAHRLSVAPEGFRHRAHGVLARLGTEPRQLLAAVAEARALVDDVESRVA
jgi:hypothetical protein